MHGVDLLEPRVAAARAAVPAADVRLADVRRLPFEAATFDAVFLFTVLSSLPSAAAVREALAETRRVLAPGGAIVVWEPRVPTPGNRATRLVGARELRAAAGPPAAEVTLTLLPPLARRLGAATPGLYGRLSRLRPLRTHRLAICRRTRS